MSETKIKTSSAGPITTLTFTAESGVNVLSSATLHHLDEAVRRVGQDAGVRVCVFTGEGKVFLAGADIKEMSVFDAAAARRHGQLGADAFDAIAALPCVTVAALNGAAMGGGLELALACDFRLAVRTARVGLPEVTLGLIPGWKGLHRLTALVGPAKARRLIFSGEGIKAEDAATLGLVDEAVNSVEDLQHRVEAFAKLFFAAGPQAVASAKRALRDGDDLTAFAECFLDHADGHEGMKAFIEKRKPRWAT